MIFPDKQSLDTFTKLSSFELTLFGLKATLEKIETDPQASSVLQTVWIKIHKVPRIAREVEVVKEITALVAKPLSVDELSLIRSEPVRVQVRCRNPAAINGSIEFFINGVGTYLRFEVEGPQGSSKGGKGGLLGPGNKPDDASDKDKDQHHKGDKMRKNSTKFDRIGKIDKEGNSSYEGSMEEALEGSGSKKEMTTGVHPIATFHPSIGLVNMDQIQDKSVENEKDKTSDSTNGVVDITTDKEEELIPNDNQFVVHNASGEYLMDKGKWPKLTLVNDPKNIDEDSVEVLT